MNRFTDDQIREFNDAFCMFDRSNRGYIFSTELREVLKTIGFNPTDKNLEEMTIVVDSDGNGEIEFDEFMNLIDELETEENAIQEASSSVVSVFKHLWNVLTAQRSSKLNSSAKPTQTAFNAFDVLGKGYVSANDLKEALFHILEKATEADKEQIIEEFKLEKNRKISFKEFKSMMTVRRQYDK